MRVLFALPGLHRHNRGAETALISIANELAKSGDSVTLIGSGHHNPTASYRFLRAASMPREGFESSPFVPMLRNEYAYEELTFVPGLLRRYRPKQYDVTLTCSYPFTNWVLRRPTFWDSRPPHVFVTQNGDWPAIARNSEYRFFGCEGLVCTNPDFFDRNKDRWRCRLIPNGVDCDHFRPGPAKRQAFSLPLDRLIVLMVSALIPTKRVERGIEGVSLIPDAHLVVAGMVHYDNQLMQRPQDSFPIDLRGYRSTQKICRHFTNLLICSCTSPKKRPLGMCSLRQWHAVYPSLRQIRRVYGGF